MSDFTGQETWHWIVTTAHRLEKAIAEELADEGVTFPEYQILALLATQQPLAEADVMRRLGLERHILTPLLGRMERHGWIHRTESPTDRRRKVIHPMPRAERLRSRLDAARQRLEGQLADALGPADLDQLRHALLALQRELDKENDQ